MIERLFLDGIDVGRDDLAIGVGDQRPGPVFTDPADAPTAGRDRAAMSAQRANDPPVLPGLP